LLSSVFLGPRGLTFQASATGEVPLRQARHPEGVNTSRLLTLLLASFSPQQLLGGSAEPFRHRAPWVIGMQVLGCLGIDPFPGEPTDVLRRLAGGVLTPRIDRLPEPLTALLLRCLAFTPGARPALDEVAQVLEPFRTPSALTELAALPNLQPPERARAQLDAWRGGHR
jgi:hypothetical protein